MSCTIYFLLIIGLILYYLFRPRYIPIFSGKDYTPKELNFTQYDNFIEEQELDPDDPYGITLLLPLEKF